MTERVQPLGEVLRTWAAKGAKEREEWLVWGLQRMAVSAYVSCAIDLTREPDSFGVHK